MDCGAEVVLYSGLPSFRAAYLLDVFHSCWFTFYSFVLVDLVCLLIYPLCLYTYLLAASPLVYLLTGLHAFRVKVTAIAESKSGFYGL